MSKQLELDLGMSDQGSLKDGTISKMNNELKQILVLANTDGVEGTLNKIVKRAHNRNVSKVVPKSQIEIRGKFLGEYVGKVVRHLLTNEIGLVTDIGFSNRTLRTPYVKVMRLTENAEDVWDTTWDVGRVIILNTSEETTTLGILEGLYLDGQY